MKIADHTGEVNKAKNGLYMTIISYRKYNDIDIQFEDGFIVYNKGYKAFLQGLIKHPNISTKVKDRTGEKRYNTVGYLMTIIAYRSVSDIDIQFEDGSIVYNKGYAEFKEGYIKHPNEALLDSRTRLNSTNLARNGLRMKIISVDSSRNIDIMFEDKTIVRGRSYGDFIRGLIGHPKINRRSFGFLGSMSLKGKAYSLCDGSCFYFCECSKCGCKDILSPSQILSHKCEV